jgi:hypothetical protein
MAKITLFSKKRMYSGAQFICVGLQKTGYDVTFCCIDPVDTYGHGDVLPIVSEEKEIIKSINECDTLILSASATLDWVYKHCPRAFVGKKVRILIGDSRYCLERDRYNDMLEGIGVSVWKSAAKLFVMPDIAKYCTVPYKIFYPPFTLTGISTNPGIELIVSHLPGEKYESDAKGTSLIKKAIENLHELYNFTFITFGSVHHTAAIYTKQRSMLYIDQLIEDNRFGSDTYKGGLGKSGIEAMMLGIPVVTSGESTDDLPMKWINKDNIEDVIGGFMANFGLLDDYRQEQYKWVLKNCSDVAVANRIMKG